MTRVRFTLLARDPPPLPRCGGLTLVECIAVVAVAVLVLVFVVVPRLTSHCLPQSARLLCASNLKGLGVTCKIYGNENDSAWPVPAFDESMIGGIDYTVAVGSGQGSSRSPDRVQLSVGGPGGARQLSVTRALWMLVRSGYTTPQQFICPSSGDAEDPVGGATSVLGRLYDFAGCRNVSYGLQVPFGPRMTRAGDWGRPGVPIMADKGPYLSAQVPLPSQSLGVAPPPPGNRNVAAPAEWRPFNSRNHGADGQNVLFADGHAEFRSMPTVGIYYDNIYTIALDNLDQASRIVGESPWARSAHPLEMTDDRGSPTPTGDSVIFP